jgi:hypothetical protein
MVASQRIHHPSEENHPVPIQEAGQAVRLYQGQPGTASSVLYTSTDNVRIVIREIILANNATAATTVAIQAGANGSAATGSVIPTATSVAASATTIQSVNVVLNLGDTIQGIQSVATAITVTINGEYVN